jgi:hypothetical protein
MRARIAFLAPLAFWLCLASTIVAQVPDPSVVSSAPQSGSNHSYIGIGADTVNPADGFLNINMPIGTPPGLGLS